MSQPKGENNAPQTDSTTAGSATGEQAEGCASGGQADNNSGIQAKSEIPPKKPSLLDSTTSSQTTSEWLAQYMNKSMGISDGPKPDSVLEKVSFEGIAKYIASDKCKNIVTMSGAGISTSAGIPDFRSPGTGLYDNLEKYNLPNPHCVFDIEYFQENPEPFFTLCKELWPGKFTPTPCHYFLKLLEEKNKLMRHYTQNIDTLERVAGLSDEKLVEAHGTFNTGHCRICETEYTQAWMKEQILKESAESPVPKCTEEDCDGVVKPDIVFFGESLPKKFHANSSDLENCDCLIIMGTSLAVQPFASLAARTKATTPRLYINLENTCNGNSAEPMLMLFFGGVQFDFDKEDNIRDIFWQGTCDDGCYALADLLGWGAELRKLVNESATAPGEKSVSKSPQTAPTSQAKTTPTKKSDL